MTLNTYSYDILTSTLNNKVSLDNLEREIKESDITISLSHISTKNGIVYISFKAELSDVEEIILTDILSSHDGEYQYKELPQKVKVIEEAPDGLDKTNGRFQADSIKIQIPNTKGTYTSTISYGFYIGLLSATWFCNEVNIGDEASFHIASDTIIGYATQTLSSGATEISVSDTVIENILAGQMITFGDNDYIHVKEVDATNKTITLCEPLSYNITINDLAKIRINVLRDFHFNGIGQITLGAAKIGSSLVPPNTPLTLEYTNNNGLEKEFSVLIEFIY